MTGFGAKRTQPCRATEFAFIHRRRKTNLRFLGLSEYRVDIGLIQIR
jgi:hypothetical protein